MEAKCTGEIILQKSTSPAAVRPRAVAEISSRNAHSISLGVYHRWRYRGRWKFEGGPESRSASVVCDSRLVAGCGWGGEARSARRSTLDARRRARTSQNNQPWRFWEITQGIVVNLYKIYSLPADVVTPSTDSRTHRSRLVSSLSFGAINHFGPYFYPTGSRKRGFIHFVVYFVTIAHNLVGTYSTDDESWPYT